MPSYRKLTCAIFTRAGTKRAKSVAVMFRYDQVTLSAGFDDGTALDLTFEANDPDIGVGTRVENRDEGAWPPGWKDIFVLRLARLPETHIHMAGFFNPDSKDDPQEACLCCMLLEPDSGASRRELLNFHNWRWKWRKVTDEEHDTLTSGRRHWRPQQQTQRQRARSARAVDAASAVTWVAPPAPPAPPAPLPKLAGPVLWPPEDPDAVTLTNADLRRLAPGEFLNDTLIDFCIKQLREELPADQRVRVMLHIDWLQAS